MHTLLGAVNTESFITYESHLKEAELCRKIRSGDKRCSIREPLTKVDTHCKQNSLSNSACKRLTDAVLDKAIEFEKRRAKDLEKMTEFIQEATDDFKKEQLKKEQ